jgi:hypothetical protein
MIENDQEKFSILVERLQKNGGKRRKPEETLEAQRSVTRRPIRYRKVDTPLRYLTLN